MSIVTRANFNYPKHRKLLRLFLPGFILGLALLFNISWNTGIARAYSCGSIPDPASDRTPNPTITDEASGIAALNNARAAEGYGPVSLPGNYYSLPPADRALILFNQERSARGLATFASNDPVLARMTYNHSQVLIDFNLFAHDDAVDGTTDKRMKKAPGVILNYLSCQQPPPEGGGLQLSLRLLR